MFAHRPNIRWWRVRGGRQRGGGRGDHSWGGGRLRGLGLGRGGERLELEEADVFLMGGDELALQAEYLLRENRGRP